MKKDIRHRHCRNDKKFVTIVLYGEELSYDIRYACWRAANMINVEMAKKPFIEPSHDDKDWVSRTVDTAINNIESRLRWAYAERNRDVVTDEVDWPKAEIVITLAFDRHEWVGSANGLMNELHNYIVNYVLGEWFKLLSPEISAMYANDARDWLDKAFDEAATYIVETPKFIL